MSHVYAPTVPRSSNVRCTRCGELTSIIQWTAGLATACRAPAPPQPAEEPRPLGYRGPQPLRDSLRAKPAEA